MKTNILISVLILLLSACSLVQKKNIGLSKSDSTKKRILASAKADVLPLNCSKFPGFIPVPGDTHLGTDSFCVMEYEAKAWHDANNNGDVDDDEIRSNGCDGQGSGCTSRTPNWGLKTHVPASVSKGKPWREISRDNAINECQELNSVYDIPKHLNRRFDLISNFEWQIIARNIEGQSVNWSGKKLGSGCVYQGNNGLDTPCSYDGDSLERGANNAKARHILSNGESINHFQGNAWEWVKNDIDPKVVQNQYMSHYSSSDYNPNSRSQGINDSCNKENRYCGFGYDFLNYSAGAAPHRGGGWSNINFDGRFAKNMSFGPSSSNFGVGFRCVFHFLSLEFSPTPGPEYE